MTKEEKDLLLKDLSARQPYNVKVHAKYTDLGETVELDGIVKMIDNDGVVGIEIINFSSARTYVPWTYVQIDNVKPYLFPMSSMTEEQRNEYHNLCSVGTDDCGDIVYFDTYESIDYLNKNKFDYRYLIPMNLVKDAIGLGIY